MSTSCLEMISTAITLLFCVNSTANDKPAYSILSNNKRRINFHMQGEIMRRTGRTPIDNNVAYGDQRSYMYKLFTGSFLIINRNINNLYFIQNMPLLL